MKSEQYELLAKQAVALIESEPDLIANLANISALLSLELTDVNWVGFYLVKGDELVLGPFQGKPACVRIPLGRGVCGSAALDERVLRIDDVHQFEGHIACDAASNSELVVPFKIDGEIAGVLDIDSPFVKRFTEVDEKGLVIMMKQVENVLNSHTNNSEFLD
ncbi:GAF domain-containing protein [Vibrio salinus]|uniref:GAF domain-containing protein n=1 Tax=Vibrio salinus TaxID=2899784 RepID=UPI001E4FB76A|nr:GAF domain-containing protein [Vibrio salinus]MCE0492562.1 GAF domain-containing protein [Vibrio salinus]